MRAERRPFSVRNVQTFLTFLLVVVLVLGVNTILWSSVGVVRLIRARMSRDLPPSAPIPLRTDVAVMIAAKDEALVISETLRSARRQLPAANLFVVSDGSTDDTAAIARLFGASVLELSPNRGKAGAIIAGLEHFEIARRFPLVLLLDADTQLAPDYFDTGLPLFDSPEVVAVAGFASTTDEPRDQTLVGKILGAYRQRAYIAVQYLHKFGQAARAVNAISIVPGFASMYRTGILAHIDIAADGLTIEDYNMTFEVHAKRLGRIAFRPGAAVAYTQDPETVHDYVKQLRRWNLGFWQTVQRHGFHLRTFWVALTLLIVELVTSSLLMILFLPILIVLLSSTVVGGSAIDPGGVTLVFADVVPPGLLVLGVLLPDYALTVFAAVAVRRPLYLLWGLAFPLVRIVDAGICLRSLADAFFHTSSGVWQSPSRREAHRQS